MTTTHLTDAWVCEDCYFAHHYGRHEHEGQWYAGESDTPAAHEPLGFLDDYELTDHTCSNHRYGQDDETVEDSYEYVTPCECCGSTDDEDGKRDFSWSRCDGCGSHLGGARHRLALWTRTSDDD